MERGTGPSTPSSAAPSRRYDGSRRQADARARRRRVVDAATELFLDHGFGETSIQRIAEEAGVSVQTVYAVFGSKAGILHAAIDVAVGGDDEDVLVRERPENAWVIEERDPRRWVREMAGFVRRSHERSAAIIHLLESVAGADETLAELVDALVAARREDAGFAVANGPLDPPSVGLTEAEAADLIGLWASVAGWIELVQRSGWTPDRYEDWLGDLFERQLVGPRPAEGGPPGDGT